MKADLNAICPYFTMFPLSFPYSVLEKRATRGECVLDPFCGRGTTNYASRLLGLHSVGIDNSPIAIAIAKAKIANTTTQAVLHEVHTILEKVQEPQDVPEGEFWELAFSPDVLKILCRLREELLRDCHSESRQALLAILLGGLHGPRPKTHQSYFSNQSQRTYAPKPDYAVRYWKTKGLYPQSVDVLDIIRMRAERYYGTETTLASGKIIQGDVRDSNVFLEIKPGISWIITSPPYYGMRTYLPDQWLRLWFLGGPSYVNYSNDGQLEHSSQEYFIQQLKQVWENVASVATSTATLVIRFGTINDRRVDAKELIYQTLRDTPWQIVAIETAGTASDGRRQALHFHHPKEACSEYDVWATKSAGN